MNQKNAKKLRKALKGLPKHYSADTVYVTEVHKGKTFDYFANQSGAADSPQDVGDRRVGRHDKLTVRAHPESYRAVYQRAKCVSAGRSPSPYNWSETESIWQPRPGFYPHSRYVDLTPRPTEPSDNGGGSGADNDLREDVPPDAPAQAG